MSCFLTCAVVGVGIPRRVARCLIQAVGGGWWEEGGISHRQAAAATCCHLPTTVHRTRPAHAIINVKIQNLAVQGNDLAVGLSSTNNTRATLVYLATRQPQAEDSTQAASVTITGNLSDVSGQTHTN